MTTDQAVQKVRDLIRLKHFSLSTEESYCLYVRQFCQHSRHLPKSMPTEKRIESYLSTFAKKEASASSQNVAFNSVLFLYRNILGIEPKGIDALRAHRPTHVRNAPAPEDTFKVLNFIKEHYSAEVSLACDLIYGCGGRVSEPLNLRIKEINRKAGLFIFRQAKGHKDRVVPIPCSVMLDLDNQISLARNIWEREGNRWPVALPGRLHLKYPNAQFAWQWFWLFPARKSCVDKRTGWTVRWRMHQATIQRAIKHACDVFGLSILPHELRHGYATDCLNNGTNPRALQQVLGHKSLETTMNYFHAEPAGVKSPLDQRDNEPIFKNRSNPGGF
jgi:integrase